MTKQEEIWQRRKAVEMWNGNRYVQVATEDVGKALNRGFIRREDREREQEIHTTVHVIHLDHSELGVHEINARILPDFLGKGYVLCDENGEPLEKTLIQKVVEKVRKPRKQKEKDESPEIEPGADNA